VYIPHNGKPSKTFKLTTPITKMMAFFMIFAIVVTSLSLVLSYFIRQNHDLNETTQHIIDTYKEQIAVSNLYIDRQATMLESKLDELNEIEFSQASISGGILNLANKLEGFSTQYFSTLPGTTAKTLDVSKISQFIDEVKEINVVLNEFQDMSEISDIQVLQFTTIKETLTDYLLYIPSAWPTESTYIGSGFGMRWHPILKVLKEHTGVDIGGAYGDEIYASASGTVVLSRYNGGYGYSVKIDHGEGITTIYGHASKLLVKEGEEVVKGQVIALVGSSGVSTGPHVHFEVRIDNVPVDPIPFINGGKD
ncbi:MAG: peptidoglycan DD-metalloendopeptidase family protein, partial [Clostridiales bacterium]|nr:peptidoglycan DD-metalloendopeptidase family protein [Clostridiales bacterium]